MMKTIDISLLETVTGGAKKGESQKLTPEPKYQMDGSCPADTAANDKLAKAWNLKNGITKNKGGNFGPLDGKNFNLYRAEYVTDTDDRRCAPGSGD